MAPIIAELDVTSALLTVTLQRFPFTLVVALQSAPGWEQGWPNKREMGVSCETCAPTSIRFDCVAHPVSYTMTDMKTILMRKPP